jgi:DNA-binding CsgD family transcriptional regulator
MSCPRCGAPTPPKKSGKPKKWCSKRCGEAASLEKHPASQVRQSKNKPLHGRALMLRQAGYGYTEIAEQLGVSERSVRRWLPCDQFPLSPEQEQMMRERSNERASKTRAASRPAQVPGVIWVSSPSGWLRAIVDPADWIRFRDLYWGIAAKRYVQTTINGRNEYLHRLLVGLQRDERWPNGERKVVDHLNRDTLDNRQANLRVGTYADNCANRGGIHENDRFTSAQDKMDVQRLIRQGFSNGDIMRELGLSRTTVQRLRDRYESAA